MTTAQLITEKNRYAEAFEHQRRNDAGNSWLARLRENSFQRFEELGFPTTDLEDWKYTNIAPLAKTDFIPATEPKISESFDAQAIKSLGYAEAAHSQLIFVNGIFQTELSDTSALANNVSVLNITEALAHETFAAMIRERFNLLADGHDDALVSLNTALFSNGAFIHVPKGVSVEQPISLVFISDSLNNTPVFSSPRVLIVAEREAQATVIESYRGLDENSAYWTNAVTEIFVDDAARVTCYKVQRESEKASHTAATRAHLLRDASLDMTTITLGAQLSRHDITVKMDREGAECWVDGLYLVGDGQHSDTHSLIDHISPHCTSHQMYKGILDGKSRAVFNGKVFVHKDARQTDAQQTNKNLLLSREARVDTKPQLEIFNDDVKCAHGATVGQLEEDELFYLLSRGLHEGIARNLLTYGFAEEVIEKIKIESIKTQLDEALLNRLHARLEA